SSSPATTTSSTGRAAWARWLSVSSWRGPWTGHAGVDTGFAARTRKGATVPRVLRRRDATLVVSSLGCVLLPGVASLARPFAGDQALFVVGGRQLLHGARMYGDFWDISVFLEDRALAQLHQRCHHLPDALPPRY